MPRAGPRRVRELSGLRRAQGELEIIGTELILWLDKKQWMDVCRHVFKHSKHTALFVDCERHSLYRLTDMKFYPLEITPHAPSSRT